MSSKSTLVVLQSERGSPARISQVFDEPLVFPAGRERPATVELVNVSVVLGDKIDIIQDVNDHCSYTIGKTNGTEINVVMPPGTYTRQEFRTQFEYQMNKDVPRVGSSWHVSEIESDDLLDKWSIRIETSFKSTVVDFDQLSSNINVPTAGSLKRSTAASGYANSYALTSHAMSRGRGWAQIDLDEDPSSAGDLPATAFGLVARQPTLTDEPTDVIVIGALVTAGKSGVDASIEIIDNGQLIPNAAKPAIDDTLRVYRRDGKFVVSLDGTDIYERATTPQEALLYPCAFIATPDATLSDAKFIPDGDTTTDALGTTIGMRNPRERSLLDGFGGTVGRSHPAYYQMNIDARASTSYVTIFEPDKLHFILGFEDDTYDTENKTRSYAFLSDEPVILGVSEGGLEISLQNLPISSRNAKTALSTKTIATIPRLETAEQSRRYYSTPYPLPVSLVFHQETALSEIVCVIKNSLGEPADIIGTTVVTLRFVH